MDAATPEAIRGMADALNRIDWERITETDMANLQRPLIRLVAQAAGALSIVDGSLTDLLMAQEPQYSLTRQYEEHLIAGIDCRRQSFDAQMVAAGMEAF